MKPFASDRFFHDEFFTESVEFCEKQYCAILSEADEVSTSGDFAQKSGIWQEISFLRADLETLPKHLDSIKARGIIFRVQGDPIFSGDVVKFKCVANQRFVK